MNHHTYRPRHLLAVALSLAALCACKPTPPDKFSIHYNTPPPSPTPTPPALSIEEDQYYKQREEMAAEAAEADIFYRSQANESLRQEQALEAASPSPAQPSPTSWDHVPPGFNESTGKIDPLPGPQVYVNGTHASPSPTP